VRGYWASTLYCHQRNARMYVREIFGNGYEELQRLYTTRNDCAGVGLY